MISTLENEDIVHENNPAKPVLVECEALKYRYLDSFKVF